MAKKLTREEEEGIDNLKNNMKSRLIDYKKQNMSKTKIELQQECQELEDYLQGCYNSEIDDTLVNIRFCERKVNILKELINQ